MMILFGCIKNYPLHNFLPWDTEYNGGMSARFHKITKYCPPAPPIDRYRSHHYSCILPAIQLARHRGPSLGHHAILSSPFLPAHPLPSYEVHQPECVSSYHRAGCENERQVYQTCMHISQFGKTETQIGV